jgi:hypothetical protein
MEWYQWLILGAVVVIMALLCLLLFKGREQVKKEQQEYHITLCNRAGCKVADDCIVHVKHHLNAWQCHRRDLFKRETSRFKARYCCNFYPKNPKL